MPLGAVPVVGRVLSMAQFAVPRDQSRATFAMRAMDRITHKNEPKTKTRAVSPDVTPDTPNTWTLSESARRNAENPQEF